MARVTSAWLEGQARVREWLRLRGNVVDGWVIIGIYRPTEVIRGIVEHAFTMNLKPASVRLWRDDPSDPAEGLDRALRQIPIFEADPALGQGLAYSIHHIDDPDCPVALDWDRLRRELLRPKPRITRGRRDPFHKLNLDFGLVVPWPDLPMRPIEVAHPELFE